MTTASGPTNNKEKTMKPMTYRDLKSKLETLSPDQLDAPIRWWGEERGGEIYGLRILECRYINDGGEGFVPVTAYEPGQLPPESAIEGDLAEGTPILESDMGDK